MMHDDKDVNNKFLSLLKVDKQNENFKLVIISMLEYLDQLKKEFPEYYEDFNSFLILLKRYYCSCSECNGSKNNNKSEITSEDIDNGAYDLSIDI